jgi:hypothetical protein
MHGPHAADVVVIDNMHRSLSESCGCRHGQPCAGVLPAKGLALGVLELPLGVLELHAAELAATKASAVTASKRIKFDLM